MPPLCWEMGTVSSQLGPAFPIPTEWRGGLLRGGATGFKALKLGEPPMQGSKADFCDLPMETLPRALPNIQQLLCLRRGQRL